MLCYKCRQSCSRMEMRERAYLRLFVLCLIYEVRPYTKASIKLYPTFTLLRNYISSVQVYTYIP